MTGKRRLPESGSESSSLVEAPSADALAMVPLTPSDGQAQGFFFFFVVVVVVGYREDVHSMQAARPTKIPDEPMLCETPALSR